MKMWFWKKVNPRTLKMIESGKFDAQLQNVAPAFTIERADPRLQAIVDRELRAHRLGHAQVRGREILCHAPVGWDDWAAALVTHTLRREGAPQEALLKLGSGALRSVWKTEGAFTRGKRTRKRPTQGDIFYYASSTVRWFGRVIRTDLPAGRGLGRASLVYFYRASAPIDATGVPVLSRDDLLVPPMKIDGTPWRQGFFATVETRPLASADVRARHCFRHPIAGKCFDEHDEPAECVGDCADHGMATWTAVEGALSIALGLPLAGPKAL
jgi:hypothetical protein